MSGPRPPRFARWILHISPLGRRPDVDADLLELFEARVRQRGERYARRRYCYDVLSLWRRALSGAGTLEPRDHFRALHVLARDLTYGARLLRRNPGMVTVAVAGLAVAIAVNTVVFSVLNALLIRPTGIRDPSSAVGVLRTHQNGHSSHWPYSEYLQLRERATLVRLEAALPDGAALSSAPGAEQSESVGLTFVSGGFLESLAGGAALGRLLAPGDDVPGAPPAAVVSHPFWSNRLASDPSAVGRTIWLNGAAFTIVGVGPRRFAGTPDMPPAVWAPIATYHLVFGGPPFDRTTTTGVHVLGRILPGASGARAAAEANAAVATLGRAPSSERAPLTGVRFTPPAGELSPGERRTIALVVAVIAVVIGLVLLLGCVNVANLLLAGVLSRSRELATRVALGASRWRIVCQLLTESVSLALLAGGLALLLTIWLAPVLAAFVLAPAAIDVAPDFLVLAFLTAVSLAAGAGAGLAPARRATRGEGAAPLNGCVARVGTGIRRGLRSTLVGLQAAASIMLLVVAALLARGMVRATQVDLGFDAERLLTVSVGFGPGTVDSARSRAYWSQALDRVRALPGVQSASLATYPPFGRASSVTILNRAGSSYTVQNNDTRADYFQTLGLRTIRGRSYTVDEVNGGARVAVVSESVARDFFPGEDPVNQSLDRVVARSRRIVIGVVSDAITSRLRELNVAAIYQPLEDELAASLIVRTEASPRNVIRSVRSALQPIDPRVRLTITPVIEGLEEQLEQPRTLAALAGTLAAIALALAVVGIYGVTAFLVGQRRHEIGVRIALGATKPDITRLLLIDSLRPVAVGLAAGVLAALLAGGVLSGVLYGLGSADPLAFSAAAVVLLSAATAAVAMPARKAATIDPASLLREG